MSHLAILCVRNEGAFLLEWLAHHQAVGFDKFLIFSNDCQDGTDTMLDQLEKMGLVTHVRNEGPYDNGGIQFTALKTAAKHKLTRKADWILPLDVDEFVNIHCGDHTLPALHAAIPDATAITLTWRLFGANGQVRYSPAPVLDTFTKAAPAIMHWPWRSAMFKTLYRNDGTYKKPGVHRPRDLNEKKKADARWFDSNGEPLPEQFVNKRIFSNFSKDNYGLVQLNHYPLGALESYVVKADRGRAVHSDHILGLDYWVERNFNTNEDTSIQSLAAPRSEALQAMLSDETLSNLHNSAVAWRKKQFETLMLKEPFRALFGRLLMTPPSQPVPREAAQFMFHFANRARRANKKKP
ncbi:glycosyltransferase family 2 protein [Sulfitobacter donghicola]|uniref:Glycosyl transferase family 2 n=1 Tax=Sulfitobacter donghicola DSW-25 = KCTC 12864 = JCM 14565 TaxID=1300350 RepID=A0A073IGL4_9RHOB|nr:glycosyltransferase family 2 protein [Sulfitobacter donghicola]KEJ89473.1 glycosyl transferase family 2 [Sulfitobacter donghicola DSW-25 = KCTC 12864 = JCM 14565]KIN69296.1 Glycosyl transferase, group 2 family protein [Sulfitobacter donghicola DSW-25 = KCTC 12864 = JCM 14565]